MLRKVKRTIEKYGMLKNGDRVLVAVSGGPDSVTLLHVLCSIRDKYNLSLSVAHLNHMLRGKDADEDARYVEKLARGVRLPFFSGKKNVRSFMKKTRLSPEEAARKLRYEFLEKVARSHDMDKVAVGQTADDQAETVLLALVRGTGLAGLAGISPVRSLGKSGIKVIRPLIEVFRTEVEEYLRMEKVTPRLDGTNLELVYLRNRVRLELLPVIRAKYNPNIKSALVGLASVLWEDNQFLVKETRKLIPEVLLKDKAKIKIDLQRFRSVPPALQQRLVREATNIISRNRQPLSLTHSRQIRELIKSGKTGSYLTLPGMVVVRKEYGDLIIMKKELSVQDGGCDLDHELEVPGRNCIPEIGFVVNVSFSECEKIPITPLRDCEAISRTQSRESCRFLGAFLKGRLRGGSKREQGGLLGSTRAVFDYDKVEFPLRIRFRTAGDRFRPLGMKGSKKLKDFFIDRKVPVAGRDKVPLLLGNGEIMWVMDPDERGWGIISERVKVTKQTTRMLQVDIVKS